MHVVEVYAPNVCENSLRKRVCTICLLLVVRETPSACFCCCTCQTKALLLSIQSERPRWCFPPSANKGPGHPACLSPPLFPSIPHSSPHPTVGPAEKTEGFSSFALALFLRHPFSFYVHGLVSSSLSHLEHSQIVKSFRV